MFDRLLARLRRPSDADLLEEMETHRAFVEAAHAADGHDAAEARRRARLDFGNATALRDQARDVWAVRWVDSAMRDARIAGRMLRASPGFALAAVATLALGIGANTAIFTVVDGLLLRPLPYATPERLVAIAPGFPVGALPILREDARHYDAVGGFTRGVEVTWVDDAQARRLSATVISGELFDVLGVTPRAGRGPALDDERPGAERVVFVSDSFAARHLGDGDVVGRSIVIDDLPRRVAGVMPASFRFPDAATDLWVPVTVDPSRPIDLWATRAMEYVGRLRQDATPAAAQSDVPRLAALVRDGFPWPMPREFGLATSVVPLQQLTMADIRHGFILLACAVALVLFVACANVATLLLARSEARGREFAVRGALGAGRARLGSQLVIESAMTAALGAAAAVGVVGVLLPALQAALPPDVPRVRDLTVDLRVAAFAAGIAILTTILTGVLPALRASRADLVSAMRAGDARSGRRTRAFGTLVAVEVALALVLVAGAGLLLRSLAGLTAVDPGFRLGQLASARVNPLETRYTTPDARVALYRRIVDEVEADPHVSRAAAVNFLPLDPGAGWIALAIEDHPVAEGAAAWTAEQRFVTPGYFDVMGIPLRAGRLFDDRDTTGAPGAILINETMARRYWPGQNAVGRRLRPVWQPEWRTVVGVVADVRNRSLAEAPEDEIYLPYAQNPVVPMTVVARASLDEWRAVGAIQAAVERIDRTAPVSDAGPVADTVRATVADRRFLMRVLTGFAAVALLLGAVGIYGVTAYGITRRAREVGLRMALGSTRTRAIAALSREMVVPISVGLILGLAAALLAGRLMEGLLYQARAGDPLLLAGVLAVLALTAGMAVLIPSTRATAGEPAAALREIR